MLVESGLGDCSSSQKVTWDSCVLRSSASDAEKRVFCTNQEFHLIVTVHSFSRDPRHEAGASHSNKKQENNPEVFKTGMAHQSLWQREGRSQTINIPALLQALCTQRKGFEQCWPPSLAETGALYFLPATWLVSHSTF